MLWVQYIFDFFNLFNDYIINNINKLYLLIQNNFFHLDTNSIKTKVEINNNLESNSIKPEFNEIEKQTNPTPKNKPIEEKLYNIDSNCKKINEKNSDNKSIININKNDEFLILIINLDHRPDRMLFMDFKMKELNLKYQRISAVKGIDFQTQYNNYMSLFNQDEINRKKNINSLGAYGLLLTYKNKISFLSEENNDSSHVMVFEDDICFHKDFLNLFNNYLDIIKNNDVIWLGCQQVRWKDYMIESVNKQGYYISDTKQYYEPWGTYGMVYSKSFLKTLNNELENDFDTKVIRNIDIYLSKIIEKFNFKSIVIFPNLILPQLFESNNTGSRDINTMKEDRKWDLSLYKYLNSTGMFESINNNIYKNSLCLRNDNLNLIDSDITNVQLSKIIENNQRSFVFIITSFNNQDWVSNNLSSILNQEYVFWRIIYVDDNSTDNTNKLVHEFVKQHNLKDKIKIIKNDTNMGQSYGRYLAYNQCFDDEICCLLDGDDWLVDDSNILTKINDLYAKHNLIMSYGQFYYYTGNNKDMFLSGKYSYSQQEIDNNDYRKRWITQHLRCVEASLLKTINSDYLRFEGSWIKCCTDIAEMYWCLERSKGRHMNHGFPTVVYNKLASETYKNSHYNIEKFPEEKLYRQKVLNYLINF